MNGRMLVLASAIAVTIGAGFAASARAENRDWGQGLAQFQPPAHAATGTYARRQKFVSNWPWIQATRRRRKSFSSAISAA